MLGKKYHEIIQILCKTSFRIRGNSTSICNKIQNRAIKITYRLPWRAKTTEIHEIAGIKLLKHRYQNLANKFIHSLETNSDLFQLQKTLHAANSNKDHTMFFDILMKNYEENYK